jgi:hypothetical protein
MIGNHFADCPYDDDMPGEIYTFRGDVGYCAGCRMPLVRRITVRLDAPTRLRLMGIVSIRCTLSTIRTSIGPTTIANRSVLP